MEPNLAARRGAVPALVGVLLTLLLVGLGTLQYRWVAQVRESERERLRAGAQRHADDLARDFDRQLAQAWAWLQVDADTLRERAFERYAQRVEQWRSLARHPELVREVYLALPAAAGPELLRLHRQARDFRSEPWPAELARVRERIAPLLAEPHETGQSRELIAPVDEDAMAFVVGIPALAPSPNGSRRDWRAAPLAAFGVIAFDAEAIRRSVLPALIRRHFDAEHESSFNVRIVRVESGEHVAGELPAPGPPDAQARLFGLRLEEVGDDLSRALAFTRRDRGPAPETQRSARRPRSGRSGAGDEPLRWVAEVRHREGPIDAVVARAQVRNLAVGFGILALLGASGALLAASAQRSRRLAQQQMAFVAGVSHELRTPVTVISTSATNLADGVVRDPEQVRRYGAVILKEARRLGEMVSQVLAFSAPAATAPRLPVDLATVAREAAESVEAERVAAGMELRLELDPAASAVSGDAASLRRAVENLLTNAVKYGRAGTAIELRLQLVQGSVHLSVSDQGMGVPEAEQERIFEPFYRGQEAVAAQIHGNGLGLSLVRRIATAHGGKVTVESRPGRGSRFTMSLPLPPRDHEQHAEPGVPEANPSR